MLRDVTAVREFVLLDVARGFKSLVFCAARDVRFAVGVRDTALSSRTAPLAMPTVAKTIAIKRQAFLIRYFLYDLLYQKSVLSTSFL